MPAMISQFEIFASDLPNLFQVFIAVVLLAVVLFSSHRIGQSLLRFVRWSELTPLETVIFRLALGLVVHSTVVLCLGLFGYLSSISVFLWLLFASAYALKTSSIDLRRSFQPVAWWRQLENMERIFFVGLFSELLLVSLAALVPTWDYDGLMYHLTAPKLFLNEGRIVLLPELWQANGPAGIEMLFAIGLAFGNQLFAKGINLGFTVLLLLSIYAFCRRTISRRVAWSAALILAAIPIFPIWATWSYIDIGWALYEFLGIWLFILWLQRSDPRWLAGAGVFTGFVVGSKYLGLGVPLITLVLIAYRSRKDPPQDVLRCIAAYVIPILVVASPWYLKNLVLSGNPLYPLFLGGPGWDAQRVAWLSDFLKSFNARTWTGYLLLPFELYFNRSIHVGQAGGVEVPSPFFLLLLFLPAIKRTRVTDYLTGYCLMRYLLWMFGSQQTRFLMPLFPVLSILSAYVLYEGMKKVVSERLALPVRTGLQLGMLVTTLIYLCLYTGDLKPWKYYAGEENESSFVARLTPAFEAWRFISQNVPEDGLVLFLWDGRGYYCDDRCLVDAEQTRWSQLVQDFGDVPSIAERLRAMGVSHMYLSKEDLAFILLHDPDGVHQRAAAFFFKEFEAACTNKLFDTQISTIYAFEC